VWTGNNPSRANPDDARLTERNALRGELLYGANMNIERNTRETLGIGIWWTFTILAFTILATVTLLGPQAF
jgi:hypothetical protein